MAVYVCDVDKHRYPEAQQSAYVTLLKGAEAQTSKLRLCPRHFGQIYDQAENSMTELRDAGEAPSTCERCLGPKTMTVFAKLYPRGAEPLQYVIETCDACGEALGHALQIGSGRPL